MTEVVGTTDVDLQEALIKEIENMNLDFRKPGTNEWIDWKVYKQMKPYKYDRVLVDENGNPLVDENGNVILIPPDASEDFDSPLIDEDGHPIMVPPETRDERQEDYIIVLIDDEDMGEDGQWTVQIDIIVSMYCEDPLQQGNMVIQNVLNRIWMNFAKKAFIDNRYEMLKKAAKRFNQEAITNFYEGLLVTRWKLPRVFPEEAVEFV